MDDLKTAVKALTKIAAYDDKEGNEVLMARGSFLGFDEPNSVRCARDAIHAISQSKKRSRYRIKTDDFLFEGNIIMEGFKRDGTSLRVAVENDEGLIMVVAPDLLEEVKR